MGRRWFNLLCFTALLLLIAGIAVTTYSAFRHPRWTWGGMRSMYSGILSLSGGQLMFDWTDDWTDPMPFVPAWKGAEAFDFDVDLVIVRVFRLRETWYPGEPNDHLSTRDREALPGFFFLRRSIRIHFDRLILATLPPLGLWLLVNRRRLSLFARRTPGQCPKCGYDLRATPERRPECGKRADAAAVGGPVTAA